MFRLGFTNVKTKVPAPRGSTRFSSIILSFPKAFCKVCWQLSACCAKCICFNARRIMHISHPCKCSKNPRCAYLPSKPMRNDAVWHILAVSGFIDYIDQRSSKALVTLCKQSSKALVDLPTVVFNLMLRLVTDPWDAGVRDYKSHCAWIKRVVHHGPNEWSHMISMRDLVWPRKYISVSMCGYTHDEN